MFCMSIIFFRQSPYNDHYVFTYSYLPLSCYPSPFSQKMCTFVDGRVMSSVCVYFSFYEYECYEAMHVHVHLHFKCSVNSIVGMINVTHRARARAANKLSMSHHSKSRSACCSDVCVCGAWSVGAHWLYSDAWYLVSLDFGHSLAGPT